MKILIMSLLVTISLSSYCISQTRITTIENDTLIGFILIETKTDLVLTSFENSKIMIDKSTINLRVDIQVQIKAGSLKLSGYIIKLNVDEIIMITEDSLKINIKLNGIDSISSEDAQSNVWLNNFLNKSKNIQNEKKSDYVYDKYRKIGVTFGLPQYVKISYGFNNQKSSAGISIGYLGLQLNVGVNLLTRKDEEFNLIILADYLQTRKTIDRYMLGNFVEKEFKLFIGPAFEIFLHGFHTQIGIGFGVADKEPNQLYFQFGYAYRTGY